MDLVLNVADYYILTPYVYPPSWPEDWALRQIMSLLVLTNLGAAGLYLGLGALSYYFIFDHNLKKHPHFLEFAIIFFAVLFNGLVFPEGEKNRGEISLKSDTFLNDQNQVQRELKYALTSLPWISVPTVVLFFAEVRGYSKLYDSVGESPLGWWGLFLSLISFLLFTDMCIYWIHRFLHHKRIYKLFHKPHHVWKISTPFASHAFHPVDGFLQGLPYHIYPFLFPLHKLLYLALYVFVNIWTISIHDGDYRVPNALKGAINGSAHHTDHHLFFDYNYGQYFTLWDRLGGSYRHPSALTGNGPHDQIRKLQAEGKLGGGRTKVKGQERGFTSKEE